MGERGERGRGSGRDNERESEREREREREKQSYSSSLLSIVSTILFAEAISSCSDSLSLCNTYNSYFGVMSPRNRYP